MDTFLSAPLLSLSFFFWTLFPVWHGGAWKLRTGVREDHLTRVCCLLSKSKMGLKKYWSLCTHICLYACVYTHTHTDKYLKRRGRNSLHNHCIRRPLKLCFVAYRTSVFTVACLQNNLKRTEKNYHQKTMWQLSRLSFCFSKDMQAVWQNRMIVPGNLDIWSILKIELVYKVDFTTRWLCYYGNTFSPLEGCKQKMGRKCRETLVNGLMLPLDLYSSFLHPPGYLRFHWGLWPRLGNRTTKPGTCSSWKLLFLKCK